MLIQDKDSMNVRSYRYPHTQKNDIDKMIAKMLAADIIRPRTSPYSTPVMLVFKKNRRWYFFVDYSALDKATILDKFPIPVMEELLDEFHGGA